MEMLDKDNSGIELYLREDNKLMLRFPGGEKRMIGEIGKTKSGRRLYIKHLKKNHLFRKFDAFGFNERAVNIISPEFVIVYYNGCPIHPPGRYGVSLEKFNEVRKYLH